MAQAKPPALALALAPARAQRLDAAAWQCQVLAPARASQQEPPRARCLGQQELHGTTATGHAIAMVLGRLAQKAPARQAPQ